MNIKNNPPGFLTRLKTFGRKTWDIVSNSKTALVATLGLGVALAGCSGKVPVKDPLASLDTGEVKGRTDSGISRANYRADLNEYLNSAGLVVSEAGTEKTNKGSKIPSVGEQSETDIGNNPKDQLIKSISDGAKDVKLETLSKESIIDLFKGLNLDHSYENRKRIYFKLTGEIYNGTQNKKYIRIFLEELQNYRQGEKNGRILEILVEIPKAVSKPIEPTKPQEITKPEEPAKSQPEVKDKPEEPKKEEVPTLKKPDDKEQKGKEKGSDALKILTAQETAVALTKKPDAKDVKIKTTDEGVSALPIDPDQVKQKNKEIFERVLAVAEKMHFNKGAFSTSQILDNQYLLFTYKLESYHVFLPKYNERGELQLWGKTKNGKFLDGKEDDIKALLLDSTQNIVSLYHKGDKINLVEKSLKTTKLEQYIKSLGKKTIYTSPTGKSMDVEILSYIENNDGTIMITLGEHKDSHGGYLQTFPLEFKNLEEMKKQFGKKIEIADKKLSGKNQISDSDEIDDHGESDLNPQTVKKILSFAREYIPFFDLKHFNEYSVAAVSAFESGCNPNINGDGIMQVIPGTRRDVIALPSFKEAQLYVPLKSPRDIKYGLLLGIGAMKLKEDMNKIQFGNDDMLKDTLVKNKEAIYAAASFHISKRIGIKFPRKDFDDLFNKIFQDANEFALYRSLVNYNACTWALCSAEKQIVGVIRGHRISYGFAVRWLAIFFEKNNFEKVYLAQN